MVLAVGTLLGIVLAGPAMASTSHQRPHIARPAAEATSRSSGRPVSGGSTNRSAVLRLEAETGAAIFIGLLIGVGLLVLRREQTAGQPGLQDRRGRPQAPGRVSGRAGRGQPASAPESSSSARSRASDEAAAGRAGPAQRAGRPGKVQYPAWLTGPVDLKESAEPSTQPSPHWAGTQDLPAEPGPALRSPLRPLASQPTSPPVAAEPTTDPTTDPTADPTPVPGWLAAPVAPAAPAAPATQRASVPPAATEAAPASLDSASGPGLPADREMASAPAVAPSPVLPEPADDAGDPPWPDFLTATGLGPSGAIHPRAAEQPADPLGVMADSAGTTPADPVGVVPAESAAAAYQGLDVPDRGLPSEPMEGRPRPADSSVPVQPPARPEAETREDAGAVSAVPPEGRPQAGPRTPKPARAPADSSPPEAFSPVALRILGAQRSFLQRAESASVPVQRHQVALGDDRIEVVLAEAPATSHDGRPRSGRTWLTANPYLVWTPLPYDAPDDGIAFACLGAGDQGCLFIDLAAAPGAVAIGGDDAAAARLAESIAHQLGQGASSGRSCSIVIVGSVLPEPYPPGAVWAAGISDLARASAASLADRTEIVFCRLRSNDDAFALARYVSSAERRVVPVVLANLPDAPWSFTAEPSRRETEGLHPAIA
jgi:hypothetical protein